jgi:hypothetical protein
VGREWALRSVFLLAAAGMLCALIVLLRRLDNRTIEAAVAAAEPSPGTQAPAEDPGAGEGPADTR